MRIQIKPFFSKLIRRKEFFSFWSFLNKLSFYGMNYGVASGYANYSGELFIIKHLKQSLNNGVILKWGLTLAIGQNF